MIDVAMLSPGHCWVTRTTNGPFIDTGIEVEFGQRGRMYLSMDALREMADVAGLLHPAVDEEEVFKRGYDLGYDESSKENHGDELSAVADRLAYLVGELRGAVLVEGGPAQPSDAGDGEVASDVDDAPDAGALGDAGDGDDLDGSVGDGAGDAPVEVRRPARRKGPAGVPANRGDGAPLRI